MPIQLKVPGGWGGYTFRGDAAATVIDPYADTGKISVGLNGYGFPSSAGSKTFTLYSLFILAESPEPAVELVTEEEGSEFPYAIAGIMGAVGVGLFFGTYAALNRSQRRQEESV